MNRVVAAAVGVCLVLGAAFQARGGPSNPHGGTLRYDPSTVETISGDVLTVEVPHRHPRRAAHGIHAMLKTDRETIAVHLAPLWYLRQQRMVIQVKDRLEVRGSRTVCDGQPCVIAAEIKNGARTLTLREADGRPLWRGRRP